MAARFPSQTDYELLIYTLPQDYPDIISSSIHLYTTSRGTAVIRGNIRLRNGLELRVSEVVDFVAGRISDYSYAVFRGAARIRWYDPQPHPEVSELSATFPHHFHEPPGIKCNRRPARGISFTEPNFSTLVADCATLRKSCCDEPRRE